MEFRIEINPILNEAIRELEDTTDVEIESIFKDLAIDAPNEWRRLMQGVKSGHPARRTTGTPFIRSAFGEAPAIESFDLYDSMVGNPEGASVIFQFAEHAVYLDPVFGGYLNRPFILEGIENAIDSYRL